MHGRPGLCPGPHWGSLHHSPDPIARLTGPISKGEGGRITLKIALLRVTEKPINGRRLSAVGKVTAGLAYRAGNTDFSGSNYFHTACGATLAKFRISPTVSLSTDD